MVSALPQHPWSINHHSYHPLARADQTSCWPARRLWQKRGQVLKVWLAPILVPALHSNPFVTLFQPLIVSWKVAFWSRLCPWRQRPDVSRPALGPSWEDIPGGLQSWRGARTLLHALFLLGLPQFCVNRVLLCLSSNCARATVRTYCKKMHGLVGSL